jgi:adenine-specific DNA-methyltransferase
MSNFDLLVTKLREVFQIDRPELDFGVYRILNARAGEIDSYLTNRLKEQVAETFTAGAAANTDALAKELTDKIAQYEADGVDPDTVPAVKKLREAIAAATTGASEHENQVFSHLLTFFSRYYDKGDFISQRRYKGDTYAIPYSGEEVMLHWANKDQYYTKSGEAFSNYGFKLEDGRSVQFRLVAADTAKDNRKDNDKDRRFVLAEARTVTRIDEDGEEYEEAIAPLSEEKGTLVVRFDYKAMPKGTKQDALVDQAVAAVLADETVKARWLALTECTPTDKNPQRTLLEKYLTNYTQKNSADYFIHKDLGGFLRRELDFYIKNEVMNLDDVQNAAAFGTIEKNLRMIQCLRRIALHLIAFLAQIEDFQKKLWLKKKFVVSAHYCVTLDLVPEELYPAIAANPAQWAQWDELGMRESAKAGSVYDLKASPYMMVDTALFDAAFRADLLKAIPDLDASTDGLLVHGDNFQALTLLQDRYREQVNCIYIDPPYNSPSSEIAYKNSFKHSSWLCLISNRIDRSVGLQAQDGGLVVAIDKYEQNGLERILNERFSDRVITSIPVEHNRKGVQGDGFSYTNEYAVFVTSRTKGAVNRYSLPEAEWEYANLRNWGGESDRTDGKTCFYPVFVKGSKICGFGDVPDDDFHPEAANIKQTDGSVAIWPIDASGDEKKWRYARDTVEGILSLLKVETARNGDLQIMKAKADSPYKTMWYATKYNAGDHGTKVLTNMGFAPGQFDFPKSIHTVSDCVSAVSNENALILDYFAGSGTTAHSVIKLNRESGGARRYALIEQGPYFDTVVKPRVQKVVYSSDWRDGKPTSPETGISHAFKVLKIESYEDTLNNLNLKRSDQQGALLEAMTAPARDDYLMRYMLDVEARGSLLSVEDFRKPFDYTLNIAIDSAGAYESRKVDLVETFNYLIGLAVRHIDIQLKQGFVTVEGTLPTGEKTLILWRDCDLLDHEGLTRLCEKLAINPADSEYKVVYINGDHNIPSVLTTSEAEGEFPKVLKLRQIEPAFLSAMFDVADV